jgi:hypothetical protein
MVRSLTSALKIVAQVNLPHSVRPHPTLQPLPPMPHRHPEVRQESNPRLSISPKLRVIFTQYINKPGGIVAIRHWRIWQLLLSNKKLEYSLLWIYFVGVWRFVLSYLPLCEILDSNASQVESQHDLILLILFLALFLRPFSLFFISFYS